MGHNSGVCATRKLHPHPPPNLPLEGGGVSGADLCAYASLEGEGNFAWLNFMVNQEES